MNSRKTIGIASPLARNDIMKRIGIFGGTFNPIHVGHLKMAEAARKEYKLSCVYFIPCGIPPHKSRQKLFPAQFRYELVKRAIKGRKYFKVLDIEIKKRKPAYTIDTILSLQGVHIGRTTKQSQLNSRKMIRLASPLARNDKIILYFLIGADEFEKLNTWNKPIQLAKLVTFLVLPRPSKNIKAPKIKNLKWSLVHTKPINISSSQIRDLIKQKKSIRGLVPVSLS
ncbi:MAG: nicotinate (nicotinamide) nucleotide adenylyltransferase [Candidatus Melainabacteria bacterium]|nr:nicotinate (nicotinamide) nucleotide adenylyltransferase [Candidatus Melainabacteria bacterium]